MWHWSVVVGPYCGELDNQGLVLRVVAMRQPVMPPSTASSLPLVDFARAAARAHNTLWRTASPRGLNSRGPAQFLDLRGPRAHISYYLVSLCVHALCFSPTLHYPACAYSLSAKSVRCQTPIRLSSFTIFALSLLFHPSYDHLFHGIKRE